MGALVHIKLSDLGWIQERQAREICSRLPYVSYGLEEDRRARIQYYMTYGCRGERISPIEIGFFTHRERDKAARDLFEKVAREVDVCVAMADATADIIRSFGSYRTEIISPGVDLAAFYPVVKLGVVGRTYATGRKGEGIVSAVMDIPRIEWHFTGHGWPGHTTSSMATSGIAWNMKPTAMFGARASWSECSVISAFNGCRVRMRPGRITRDGTCMSKPISE